MKGCSLTFWGAAGTVTGSRHLLETPEGRMLVDCGLFQGNRALRALNWERFPVPPSGIDQAVLTHAHLDHSGYLPRLVKEGFGGPIHCTRATAELLEIMLLDAARLQMEDARHANRHDYSRHKPALPLYDEEDARRALALLHPHDYETPLQPLPDVICSFRRAGHILGSAYVLANAPGGRICFGGDLGRYGQSIIPDPEPVEQADYLLLESTYGDRDHSSIDAAQELARLLRRVEHDRSFLLVPAFSIGRAQELLYLLNQLWAAGEAPVIPVYLDSPMAISAVPLFCRHTADHDLEMTELLKTDACPLESPAFHFVQTSDQSKALNGLAGPGMIIAGSGMANGGRIRHHLRNRIDDPRTVVLFVGYQGEGTPGRALLDGAHTFRAYGWEVPVRAHIESIDALSAHADRGEIIRWLGGFQSPPRHTFLVHGEDPARQALQARILTTLGWSSSLPRLGESVELGRSGVSTGAQVET